jgi:hypothetical protein
MIDIELTIKYFNGQTFKSTEFTTIHLTDAKTLDEAREAARSILAGEEKAAYDAGAMMETFYFEYDFLVPRELMGV